MTKLIIMKFTVTIKDEDIPHVLPDDEVKRELIEAYNDWIRTDECSDVEIIIEEEEK